MKKKLAIFALLFFLIPYFVYAISTFVIEETEKLSLSLNASDPDSDDVIVTYSEPLNQNGEWQTNYGDAGEYGTTITVSDGESSITEEIVIIVRKREEKPFIESYSPDEDSFSIQESESIQFTIVAKDMNNDRLFYEWLLDGKLKSSEDSFILYTDLDDEGSHEVTVTISDGKSKTTKSWDVEVNDVDIKEILNDIPDVEIDENEIAKLELPDLKKYGLTYSISEPIGNDNEWQTSYEDAGKHNVKIRVESKSFSEEDNVQIMVKDMDRPPSVKEIGPVTVSEGEEVQLKLEGQDPDGDKIIFLADNLPNGAVLKDDIFKWTPDHDFVKGEGFWDWLSRRISGLSKNQYVEFSAISKDKEVLQNAIITVKDANRAPVIEDLKPITIKEGESLSLSPIIYDPDGDSVKVSYSGLSSVSSYTTGYNDEGNHEIKISASDGEFTTENTVSIEVQNTNRAPYLKKISPVNVIEGDTISVLLDGVDPDGDNLQYFADNLPDGAQIKGNAFIWTPSFDFTDSGTKKIDLVFVVADSELESKNIITFFVQNKNRPPKIINTKGTVTTKVNKPVLMAVEAQDPDGNDLKYTWEFNLLEKYDATQSHQRIFNSRGLKQVKVTVSDGIEETTHLINVNVV